MGESDIEEYVKRGYKPKRIHMHKPGTDKKGVEASRVEERNGRR